MRIMRQFGTDRRGSTAVLFGLTMLPLLAAVGGAVDYSRAASHHSRAQLAADTAALALVKEDPTATDAEIQLKGRSFVEAALGGPDGARGFTLGRVEATRTGRTVRVSVAGSVRPAFMSMIGVTAMPVTVQGQSTWRTKLELALVLDNTGSMGQTIGGRRKIDELRSAARDMLGKLRALADAPDTVKVSLVPFDTEVRLDPAYRDQPWFRWANPQNRRSWSGYLVDRYGSYAVSNAAPSPAIPDSLFAPVGVSQWTGDLATLRPLTSLFRAEDHAALDGAVAAMTPRGNTNVALGVAWGMTTLTRNAPFPEAAPAGAAGTRKIMIVLTDGTNTENHVDGVARDDAPQIDAKTAATCALAKREGIEMYTVRLLSGDETLLRNCASNPGNYFDVQNAGELGAVFRRILDAVAGTRISA